MSLLKSVSSGVQVPSASSPSSTTGGSDFEDYTVPEPYVPPEPGEGWTRLINFEPVAGEGAVLDTKAEADGIGFDDVAGHTFYSNTQVHTGSRSAQMNINLYSRTDLAYREGAEFGLWGGGIHYNSTLGEGDQIWFRAYVWFPVGFEITSGLTEGLKFMRFHVKTETGAHIGFHHTFIRRDTSERCGLGIGTEIVESELWANNGGETGLRGDDLKGIAKIPYGEWVQVECQIRFSGVAGQGRYRHWVNKVLVLEDKLSRTLRKTTDKSDFIYHHTNWNGLIPPYRQSHYIDNIVVTTQTPSETDAAGNPCIGLGV